MPADLLSMFSGRKGLLPSMLLIGWTIIAVLVLAELTLFAQILRRQRVAL